jgi:hypothetical protein
MMRFLISASLFVYFHSTSIQSDKTSMLKDTFMHCKMSFMQDSLLPYHLLSCMFPIFEGFFYHLKNILV